MADIEQPQRDSTEKKNKITAWKCVAKAKLPVVKSVLHDIIGHLNKNSRPCMRYEDYKESWSLQSYWQVLDVFENLLQEVCKDSFTKDQVFSCLGDVLPDTYKEEIYHVIDSRREDIRKHALAKTTAVSQRKLVNFDWKVNLVMSSDKLGLVQEPLCNLDFEINNNDQKTKTSIELTSEDLKTLIKSLEAANKTVMQYTS
ncbi:COMMD8 [Acanthosepion pharaonis]|uniref:COMMD8 n=1 Tax=Acanthosepion pharaonis TaxID=158019 RepID=A0A812CTB8_ACAPH|nr:COMMD8 [Sepia pharaonis]